MPEEESSIGKSATGNTAMQGTAKGNAIVMGATSGIGREVAKIFIDKGFRVGVAGRREDALASLAELAPERVFTERIDITAPDAPARLLGLIERMGGISLYLHCSGYGSQNLALDIGIENQTVMTNVYGFTRMIDTVYHYFAERCTDGSGTSCSAGNSAGNSAEKSASNSAGNSAEKSASNSAGNTMSNSAGNTMSNSAGISAGKQKCDYRIGFISSIAGTKGLGAAPSYSATKRYQWIYAEALAQQAHIGKKRIKFTDIRPGFVATDFLGSTNYPMMMERKYVARKIVKALLKGKRRVIIDWKYRVLVLFWRLVPSCIWERLKITNN